MNQRRMIIGHIYNIPSAFPYIVFEKPISENMELMRNCGFKAVEILWLSNMQVGLWGIK